ncbi:MAG: carboxylating nicotinate-nucleotide diphosphorylase [Candidatus Thermochlorobacter sp.]
MSRRTPVHPFAEFHAHCETQAIELAMLEDLYDGDLTTEAIIPKTHRSKGVIRAKSDGVIAGVRVMERIFSMSKNKMSIHVHKHDGEPVKSGDIIAEVTGSTETLLLCERTVLNFMQRMSGIATKTAEWVKLIAHTKAKLLDTRKTAPALRYFDKEAVRIGGGVNHRFGLYDMILIKDNHIDAAGSISEAIRRAKDYRMRKGLEVKIEVEVRSQEEVQEALRFSPDMLLLDNFSLDALKKAVTFVRAKSSKVLLEASGGVSQETLCQIAETGVDFISAGALTHSVSAMDISMKITPLSNAIQ